MATDCLFQVEVVPWRRLCALGWGQDIVSDQISTLEGAGVWVQAQVAEIAPIELDHHVGEFEGLEYHDLMQTIADEAKDMGFDIVKRSWGIMTIDFPKAEYAIRSQLRWQGDGVNWILLRKRRRVNGARKAQQTGGVFSAPSPPMRLIGRPATPPHTTADSIA